MDLLFKNFPYFMDVYFNFSLTDYGTVFFLCTAIFWGLQLCCERKYENRMDFPVSLLFAAYFSTVVCITLLNQNRENCRQLILNPFIAIRGLKGELGVHYLRGIVSNVIMFIPFGMFASLRFKSKAILRSGLWGAVCSIVIEAAQYVFQKGVTETLDIICNAFGSLLGASLVSLFTMIKKREMKDAQ